MKLIDADALVQPDFSMQVMPVKEMLDKYTEGCPKEMAAIPVEWIINYMQESNLSDSVAISKLLRLWEKEKDEVSKVCR